MDNTQNQSLTPKMIFCDIDGTLIDDKNVISPIAINGLQDLINYHCDFHFALVSGRAIAHEKYFYSQLGLKPTGFLIGNNGSQIYSLKEQKVIAQWHLPSNVAQAIYNEVKLLDKKSGKISMLVSYSDEPLAYIYRPDNTWPIYNINDILQVRQEFSANNVLLITIFHLEEQLEEMIAFLHHFNLTYVPGPNLTAITNGGITKRHAIEYILKKLDVPPNNVAVFGDSKNDISMFEMPGVYSITYQSAKDYLKKIACDVVNEPVSAFIATGLKDFVRYLKQHH